MIYNNITTKTPIDKGWSGDKKYCITDWEWFDNFQNSVPTWYHSPQYCFCGHDCSRCITYLATVNNDGGLRRQSQAFYREFMKREIPLADISCHGGRSNDVFCLCKDCPFMKCCKEKGLTSCAECENQCRMFLEYRERYVNKYNQI